MRTAFLFFAGPALIGLLACSDDTASDRRPVSDSSAPDTSAGAAPANEASQDPTQPLVATATGMPQLSCGGLQGASTCDPVTAWPCDIEAGENCLFGNAEDRFRCTPGPHNAGLCEACGYGVTGCAPGFTCARPLFCVRHCCQDQDCGQGRCQLNAYDETTLAAIGYCLDEALALCLPPELDAGLSEADSGGN
jgi:hypothetical protein